MSKKVRVTPELVARAHKIFEEAKVKKRPVESNVELSRHELKALERKGYVRKMIIFGNKKYSGYTGSQTYVWSWVGTDMIKETSYGQ